MPRRSFYDVNRQGAINYPDYDQAAFEQARSTIRGPEYSGTPKNNSNRYYNDMNGTNRGGTRSLKMQDKNGGERGATDEIAKQNLFTSHLNTDFEKKQDCVEQQTEQMLYGQYLADLKDRSSPMTSAPMTFKQFGEMLKRKQQAEEEAFRKMEAD